MPNFDAGTYFLTILAPVKTGIIQESDGSSWEAKYRHALAVTESQGIAGYNPSDGAEQSFVQRLRTVLATLPTALQSPATIEIGVQSPFARNSRNHLCRFAVIENVIYNGRTPADRILGSIPIIKKFFGSKKFFGGGDNLLVAQKVDNLKRPYLMFTADVDAVVDDGTTLPAELSEAEQDRIRDGYLAKLWETAKEELQAVFENCAGFENVDDARSFTDYMVKCQVETTMPFHDYGLDVGGLKTLPVSLFKYMAIPPAIIFALAALGWLFGLPSPSGIVAVIALLLTAVSVAIIYKWAIDNGNKPFPPARRSDLPSVLKALYLQQKFADFVIANQGAKPADMHKAFGNFIDSHKPLNKNQPTQKPGYISSNEPDAVQQ